MVPVCNADRLMMDDNEHIPHSLDLAGKMEPALVMIGCDASAASLCSALHGFGSSTITGQTASKKKLESNPCINTNTEQPFIQVSLERLLVFLYRLRTLRIFLTFMIAFHCNYLQLYGFRSSFVR